MATASRALNARQRGNFAQKKRAAAVSILELAESDRSLALPVEC
jgi:hypothetical protein